jgi:hypothetical protein
MAAPASLDSTVIDELGELIDRHVYLSADGKNALLLWILYSYLGQVFWHQPRLVLHSPTKRSGKTTVLKLLQLLCWNPIHASNASPAALFRMIDMSQPTLLLDEADTYFKSNEDMRGLINAGFERNGMIWRCVGDKPEPKGFQCACPTAIAGIGTLADTIIDRSIVIPMERKPKSVSLPVLEPHRHTFWAEVQTKLKEWADHNKARLEAVNPDMSGLSSDRAADVWRPLFAIAHLLGGDWPALARRAAKTLTASSSTALDEDPGQLVLSDIRDIFFRTKKDRLPSAEICAQLATMEDRPWPEWSRGRAITTHQLARLLSPFKIRSMSIRIADGSTPKGYHKVYFETAWERYL